MTVHHLARDATVVCPWVMDFVFHFGIKIAWDDIMMVKPWIVLRKWGEKSRLISKSQCLRGPIVRCSSMR